LAGILAGTAGLGVLTACGSTTVTATTSSAASSQNSAVSSQVAGAGTATSQAFHWRCDQSGIVRRGHDLGVGQGGRNRRQHDPD